MNLSYKLTFSGRLYYRLNSGLSSHYHPDNQIQLVYSGEALSHVNGREYRLKKGDVMIVPEGSVHDFQVLSSKGMKTVELKFTTGDEALKSILAEIGTVCHDGDEKVFDLISRIVLEGQRKNLYYKEMSNTLLMECFLLLYRIARSMMVPIYADGGGDAAGGGLADQALMSSIDDFIAQNIEKKFVLADLAEYCGYSKGYIYRYIRKIRGVSAIGYVNNFKFERAKQMILHTDLSLSEIAWNLGFETLQYFSRFFKEHAGVSPSSYSQKVRSTFRIDY